MCAPPLVERTDGVPRWRTASALGVVVAPEAFGPAGMYTDEEFMAWLRPRERVGLADEDWKVTCSLPLHERADDQRVLG